jgi:catechol 2,3-dioxygenase-like lactoylglutathione lyase family enzyme
MRFPAAIPEVPVTSLAAALAYYRDRLGFTVDWSDEALGLAGVSRDEARLFLADSGYRSNLGNPGPAVLWLNLSGRGAVDGLHEQWSEAGAAVEAPPSAKPYKLYEFLARDPDGNLFRVFYDFARDEVSGSDR